MNRSERLHTQYITCVEEYVKRKVFNSSDREDIVQDVFVRVNRLLNNGGFPSEEKLESVAMINIVSGLVNNYIKRKTLHEVPNETSCGATMDNLPWDSERSTAADQVETIAESLRPKFREIFLLLATGMTHEQIATNLGLKTTTVSTRVSRMYAELRGRRATSAVA